MIGASHSTDAIGSKNVEKQSTKNLYDSLVAKFFRNVRREFCTLGVNEDWSEYNGTYIKKHYFENDVIGSQIHRSSCKATGKLGSRELASILTQRAFSF